MFWVMRGRVAEGRAWIERALELDPVEDHTRRSLLSGLAVLAYMAGDYAAATVAADDAAALATQLGPSADRTADLRAQIASAMAHDDFATAEPLYEDLLVVARADDNGVRTSACRINLAYIANRTGRHERAEALMLENLPFVRGRGQARCEATTLVTLAETTTYLDQPAASVDYAVAAAEVAPHAADALLLIEDLRWYAAAAVRLGDPERIAEILGACEAAESELEAALEPHETAVRDELVATLRRALTDEGLEAARTRGRSMDLATAAALMRAPVPMARSAGHRPDRDVALVHHAERAVAGPGHEPERVGTRAEVLDLEDEAHAGLAVDGGSTGDRGARRLDGERVDRRGIHARAAVAVAEVDPSGRRRRAGDVAHVERELCSAADCGALEDRELRQLALGLSAAPRPAGGVDRHGEARGARAGAEGVHVEAAGHVAGVDVALVLLGRPRVGAGHDVPAARVAPIGQFALGDPIGGRGSGRDSRSTTRPRRSARRRPGWRAATRRRRSRPGSGRARRSRCRRCGRRGSCSHARFGRCRPAPVRAGRARGRGSGRTSVPIRVGVAGAETSQKCMPPMIPCGSVLQAVLLSAAASLIGEDEDAAVRADVGLVGGREVARVRSPPGSVLFGMKAIVVASRSKMFETSTM